MTELDERFLVRGKRVNNEEWIEGFYYRTPEFTLDYVTIPCIMADGIHYEKVIQETLGRYTGLKDKNGKRIFDGDFLKGFDYPFFSGDSHDYFAEVVWLENSPAFGLLTHKNPKASVRGISDGNIEYVENFDSSKWQVIGNIFDNPELLGDEKNA